MERTINNTISLAELAELRFKYRNGPEVSRIIDALEVEMTEDCGHEQELDDMRMKVVTAEVEHDQMLKKLRQAHELLGEFLAG